MDEKKDQISDSFVSKKIQFIKEAWNEHLWVRLLLIFAAILLSALLIFLLFIISKLIIPLLKLKIEFQYDYLVDTFNNNPFLQKNALYDLSSFKDTFNKIEKLLEFEVFQQIILLIQGENNNNLIIRINPINTITELQLKLNHIINERKDNSNQNLDNLKALIQNIPNIQNFKNNIKIFENDIQNFYTKSTKERNQLFSSLEIQFDNLHQAISNSFESILKLDKTYGENEDRGYNNLLEEVQNTIKIWVNTAINFYTEEMNFEAGNFNKNLNKPFNKQFEENLEQHFTRQSNNLTTKKTNQQTQNNRIVDKNPSNQDSNISIYDGKSIDGKPKTEEKNAANTTHSNNLPNLNTLSTIKEEAGKEPTQSQNSLNNNIHKESKVKITSTIEIPEVKTVQKTEKPFNAELTSDDNSILEKFNNIQSDQIDDKFSQEIIQNIRHLMQFIINGSIGTMIDSNKELYEKINPLIEKYNLHNINNFLEILNNPETIKNKINNIVLFIKHAKHYLQSSGNSQTINNLDKQLKELNDKIKKLSKDINLSNEEKITNLILNDLNDQDKATVLTSRTNDSLILNYENCKTILDELKRIQLRVINDEENKIIELDNPSESKNENNITYEKKIEKLIQIVQDYSNHSEEMKLFAEIRTLNSTLEIKKNTILNDIGQIKFDEYQLLWSEQSKKLITKIGNDQNNLNELNKTIHNIIYNLNEIQNPISMLDSMPVRDKKVELPALFIRKNNNDFQEKDELNIIITQLKILYNKIPEAIQLEKQIYDKNTELKNLKTPNNKINIFERLIKKIAKQ
jgi:hypothetical protein